MKSFKHGGHTGSYLIKLCEYNKFIENIDKPMNNIFKTQNKY